MSSDYGRKACEIISLLLEKDPRVWEKLEEMQEEHPEWTDVIEYLVKDRTIPHAEEPEDDGLPF